MKNLTLQIAASLDELRLKKPLIHHLTNHVVMTDCAAVTANIGGSPVMTLAPEEASEMVSMAGGLVLNIGTLTSSLVEVMISAGKAANAKNIPVLFDPVGAGATLMRTEAAKKILKEVQVDVVKGNLGEMSVLSGISASVRGVDSAGSSGEPGDVADKFFGVYDAAAVITGKHDYISHSGRTFRVKNGHVMLSRLVGTGCMLGSVIACFCSVMSDRSYAALAGTACFGIAAELAGDGPGGPAAFKIRFFDELYALGPDKIIQNASFEQIR